MSDNFFKNRFHCLPYRASGVFSMTRKYLRLVPILWYFLEPTRRTRHPVVAPAKIQNFLKFFENFITFSSVQTFFRVNFQKLILIFHKLKIL